MFPNSSSKFMFFREFSLAVVLIMVTIMMYMILASPLNSVYTLASGFVSGSNQTALDFTVTMFGAGFVLLALGLLVWGTASAVRRGEDSARF